MSNIDAVKALIAAINLDRFDRIEALHQPDVTFWPFSGPPVVGSVSVQDWYTEFLRDYADCTYAEEEFIDDGDVVAVRATLQAKGYNWRAFTQRVLDVCEMKDGKVATRRLYAMLPNLELDKAATAAMNSATGFRGGSASETRQVAQAFFAAWIADDADSMKACLAEKAALVETVHGTVSDPEAIAGAHARMASPAMGSWQVTGIYGGTKDAVVEAAINPERPRLASWIRAVDGKIAVIEMYWMLREIGIGPESKTRHMRRVIHPM